MAKIVLVDDDPISLRIAEKRLSASGHEVLTASDGKTGLQLVRAEKPQLVLTDLMMPGMHGFSLIQEIRNDPSLSQTQVIVSSGKAYPVDVGIVGDLRETLEGLMPGVKSADHSEWLDTINEMKGDSAVRDIQSLPDTGHLYAAHVINDIWRYTEGKAIVVSDVGQHQMWEAQYYKHEAPRSLITSGGLGTMGFALPAAIGAKFACQEGEIWVIAGDGGFQMTMAELATIAQENIKVNVAIINNGYLGMVRQWQEFFYERRYAATPMLSPDFVKVAEAYGLKGIRVTERSQTAAAVEDARTDPGTALIDFRVEQEDSVFPMVPAGADLHAMIRRPAPKVNVMVETGADREWELAK